MANPAPLPEPAFETCGYRVFPWEDGFLAFPSRLKDLNPCREEDRDHPEVLRIRADTAGEARWQLNWVFLNMRRA
jgi:hypothetical protein